MLCLQQNYVLPSNNLFEVPGLIFDFDRRGGLAKNLLAGGGAAHSQPCRDPS